ncbi:MAG TPA: trigger factor [Haliangium sp.]|nr:trigger factor [Haliangium sp.]
MQVRIEDVSPVEKKLIVEVPWATVNDKISEMYRKLSKSVQLKGFRKGKVPLSVLQRMYSKHIKSDVTEQLVREGFVAAASEHELDAVSEPRLERLGEIENGQPFSFEAIIEVKGQIEPKDYDGMPLTRRPLAVTEEEIDQVVEKMRQEHVELLPIEGRDVTARTDVITISLKGTIGEQEVEQPQMHVDLSAPDREPLPGMVQALLGLPLNVEDHKLEITLPEDFQESSVAGQKASFSISIRDARAKHLPDIDDDFAKDVDRGETVAELRQSVRGDIEKQKQTQIDRELRDAALEELVNRNQIPVAPALVERGLDFQLQRLQSMFGQLGPDSLGALPPDVRERMRPRAIDEIRGQLLLEALAEKESIEVGDADVEQYINEIAKMRDESPARVRAELARDGRLESVANQLRQDKVLELLVSRAIVTEREPAPEGSEAAPGSAGTAESAESTEPGAP